MGSRCGYRGLGILGYGSFGTVILAESIPEGTLVAVKRLRRTQIQDAKYVEAELLSHSMLQHPNIVKFHKAFLTQANLNIVLDYVPDGTLLTHIKEVGCLPESKARWLFQQLMLAVDYCHKKGVVIRDIKADNILLDMTENGPNQPLLQICDFGYATSDARSISAAISGVGTLEYMAPEVHQTIYTPGSRYNGQAADIWCCGVVLYIMLTGMFPFHNCPRHDTNFDQLSQSLLEDKCEERYNVPSSLSDGVQDLLHRLLQPFPQDRITMADVIEHPWFMEGLPAQAVSDNDWHLLYPRACEQSLDELRAIAAQAPIAAEPHS
eukprot:GHRR01000773.1.p1 GENE.GHRR01000773.1~~GHRR01000773.1.p1  ORF type:complete len:322 (+),score=72.14 GHRR01000773.1:281-1246(+)